MAATIAFLFLDRGRFRFQMFFKKIVKNIYLLRKIFFYNEPIYISVDQNCSIPYYSIPITNTI